MYRINNVSVEEERITKLTMSEIGITSEYCLMNGTPSILNVNGLSYYFDKVYYTGDVSDVDFFGYVSETGKYLKLFNK